jgi:mono/diheme cytochrome c family protein
MRHFAPIIVVGLLLLIVVAACGQPAATPTAVPPTTAAPPVATAAPAGTTTGQLAQLGKSVYDMSCSACHAGGPGPAVSAWMQAFPNAQQIFDYASRNMPKGAGGSLQPEQYFQIVAWALVDQKIVSPDTVLDINKLATVATKK